MPEQNSYQDKKAFFNKVLTIYGRKAVLEALQDTTLPCHAVHLASSNRRDRIIDEIEAAARQRDITVKHHSRAELARISRNGRQDQGVAADILCPSFSSVEEFLASRLDGPSLRLLALDGITNPQNLGMIIRSAAAGAIDGIIHSGRGNAALGPLVIKASAGTIYRAPMLQCQSLRATLQRCQDDGVSICTLEGSATTSLFEFEPPRHCVFVLGNESDGVSREISALADTALSIPMHNGVESLNVAIASALVAFSGMLKPSL
jgi:23S rRNA (guanosine2251-2'-O)-methyltransferase